MKAATMMAVLIFFSTGAWGGELIVSKFSTGDLSGWRDKIFKGKTAYAIVKDGDRNVLKAHSQKAASGLVREIAVDAKKYPVLRWSWKVEHSLKKEDVTKKNGDDFAARVYVVFPRTFFWQMRAINYVWAAKMPKGSTAPSPYTSNAMIVAVESGDEKAGQWVTEERNINEDYKRLFGEEPPAVGAIAVMSDTDDTRDEVTAWFGDILLESGPKEKVANGKNGVVPEQNPKPAMPAPSPAK